MKILVINAPNNPYTDESLLIEPIDVLTVATFTRSLGHEVVVRDFDRQKRVAESIEIELATLQPEIVIIPFDYHIPLYTSAAIPGVAEMARRAVQAGCKVILGGRPCEFHPELFLSETSLSTVIAQGELEPVVEDLLSEAEWSREVLSQTAGIIFRGLEGLVATPKRRRGFDLSRLPIPDRSLLPVEDYIDVRSLLSSRGCVEKCSFCPVHQFWGRWRQRSPEAVVEELHYLSNSCNAEKILFLDDHTTANPKRMREIASLLIQNPIKAALGCLGTAHSLDEETLRMMSVAGFRWLHVGAEYASDRLLALMGKRTRVADIRRTVTAAKALGFRVRTSWILDAPEATPEELADTLALIEELRPHEVRAHFLSLRAGAPLAQGITPNAEELLTSQYIHEGKPHNTLSNMSPDYIKQTVDEAVERLRESGYLIVRDPADWAIMNESRHSTPDVHFVSFCPGRYGIGWRRDHETALAA